MAERVAAGIFLCFVVVFSSGHLVLAEPEPTGQDLLNQFLPAAEVGDWPTAVSRGRELTDLVPERPLPRYLLACALAMAGETDEAAKQLQQGARSGLDDPEEVEAEESLATVRSHPDYALALQVIHENQRRARAEFERRAGESEVLLFPPSGYDPRNPAPLIVALHAYGGHAARTAERWRELAAAQGAILAVPQGVRPVAGGGFQWGEVEEAESLVLGAVDRAAERYVVDRGRTILAGFSEGGFMAVHIRRRHPGSFVGLVAAGADDLPPATDFGEPLPGVYLLVGERDPGRAGNERALEEYRGRGLRVELEVLPERGHEFPSAGPLERGLRFVLSHDEDAGSAARSDRAHLESLLAEARKKHAMPALGALLLEDGEVHALAVAGRRSLAAEEAATREDHWQLASNGKALTATLLARLVEKGKVAFDTELDAVFPGLAEAMHPAFRKATLRMLLNHSAGLPHDLFETDEEYFERFLGARETLEEQRLWIVREGLARAPVYRPGSEHSYSNLGYVIAGAVAERVGGAPWEELVVDEVLKPLGISSFGFSDSPASPGTADQPWGHRAEKSGLVPVDPADPRANWPQTEAPAGIIHMALRDWARFAQEHLDGAAGRGKLLSGGTYRELHLPADGEGFGLGWSAVFRDGRISNLQHTGGTDS